MRKILDQKSAAYSFALHVLQGLEGHVGDMALQGGLGIALAVNHTRQTGDVDISVSPACLVKLETELPALVASLFKKKPWRWTRCTQRDPGFHIQWTGRDRIRRLRVSWWSDDQTLTKEHVEFEFYTVSRDVLRQYPTQLVCLHDQHTGSNLEFVMQMPSPATALADKVTAIINSDRVRLIDYMDASSILHDQSDAELIEAVKALEPILSAYTQESIDELLRKCLTKRPEVEVAELARQQLAISEKVPNDLITSHAGNIERFSETRSKIMMTAFAMLVGARYINGGGPTIQRTPKTTRHSFGM